MRCWLSWRSSIFFFFKQKTAYEMRISDWSSDVCSSDFYIDGFVLAVPTANKQKFIDHANEGDSVFMEYGATRVLECWGDDVPEIGRASCRERVCQYV